MSRERAPQQSRPFPDLDPDVDETEISLFDLNMPGVLTLDEVKALNLNQWLLLYHGSFVQMEVRVQVPFFFPLPTTMNSSHTLICKQDLVGWDQMPMDNPQSVKGIVAELAAVLGPKIVKDSAVVLFD